jgi:hypothetical protein
MAIGGGLVAFALVAGVLIEIFTNDAFSNQRKNPFAELDHAKAIRDCREKALTEVGRINSVSGDTRTNHFKYRMRLELKALAYLSRIQLTKENQGALTRCLVDYPDFALAQATYYFTFESHHERREVAELNGPANGSQPIRSETNQTSSAAGSRR